MTEGKPFVTILLVTIVASAAAVLVTASWEFSRERIAANERALLLQSLSSVLDPALLTRDLDPILISVSDRALLGSDEPVEVFVPMDGDTPLAIVFASIAPDGYNAPIALLIGIDIDTSRISGVRVINHRETPGLGDLIEVTKSNWIRQFDGRRIGDPPEAGWALRRDDGSFDSITGATVTPRAVVKAVRNTLLYFERNRDALIREAQSLAQARETQATPEQN